MASKLWSLDKCHKCGINKNHYNGPKGIWERVNCGCKKPGGGEDKTLKKPPNS